VNSFLSEIGRRATLIPPAATPFVPQAITTYLQERGHAGACLDHANEPSRITKLFDRTREEFSFKEVDRIRI
jgi:hypothetical protein